MAPHSSTLAWKIPWTEEPSWLPEWTWLSDFTFNFHFPLSCIGEGNGNPLQCSCLENSRDGGAWWAAVYGVTQSWTRLTWLSSSSSSRVKNRTRLRDFSFNFHFPLSCIGEGNDNPLQCSCLENPRDGKPGGLPSMGLHGVGHNWSDLAAAAAAADIHIQIFVWKLFFSSFR